MKNPIELLLLWFFSQEIVLYISFVPAAALAFITGVISFTRKGNRNA